MKFKIVTAVPNKRDKFVYEVMNCIEYIQSSKAFKNFNIISINAFIDSIDEEDYIYKCDLINSLFKIELKNEITINCLAQKPMIDGSIAFELHLIHKDEGIITHEYNYGTSYTKLTLPSYDYMLFVSIDSNYSTFTNVAYEHAFNRAKIILNEECLNFSNIYRQWNYIEDILGTSDRKQNYQTFNTIRAHFYNPDFSKGKNGYEKFDGYEYFNGYPSASGIGTKYGGFQMTFYAASNGADIKSVENKLQTSAYHYSKKVLHDNKETPKFDRAKRVDDKIFISGTASIRGEKTKGVDSPYKQQKITNENISVLMVGGNDEYHLLYTRTYIKDENYNHTIEQSKICQRNLTVVADICRDDLLVEVEGFGEKINLK